MAFCHKCGFQLKAPLVCAATVAITVLLTVTIGTQTPQKGKVPNPGVQTAGSWKEYSHEALGLTISLPAAPFRSETYAPGGNSLGAEVEMYKCAAGDVFIAYGGYRYPATHVYNLEKGAKLVQGDIEDNLSKSGGVPKTRANQPETRDGYPGRRLSGTLVADGQKYAYDGLVLSHKNRAWLIYCIYPDTASCKTVAARAIGSFTVSVSE